MRAAAPPGPGRRERLGASLPPGEPERSGRKRRRPFVCLTRRCLPGTARGAADPASASLCLTMGP